MNVQAIAIEHSARITSGRGSSRITKCDKIYQDKRYRIKLEKAISCVPKTGKERKRGCSPGPTIQPACLGA